MVGSHTLLYHDEQAKTVIVFQKYFLSREVFVQRGENSKYRAKCVLCSVVKIVERVDFLYKKLFSYGRVRVWSEFEISSAREHNNQFLRREERKIPRNEEVCRAAVRDGDANPEKECREKFKPEEECKKKSK